jgi:hypothetical protein
MNLQDKALTVDLDNPKQLYDFELLNCKLTVQNLGIRNVFEVYCEFYELKKTAELAVRFRYFWAGRKKDIDLLSSYKEFIQSL